MRAVGAGVASDITYARGVPADPSPEIDSFNRKDCSFLLFEVGFCRDLGCRKKREEKSDKYSLLLITLRRYWGRVDLVCIPIGRVRDIFHFISFHNTFCHLKSDYNINIIR